jgi:hypothetical protein
MPSPRATRWSSTAARNRLPKRVCQHDLQRDREHAANDDDQQPVLADARAQHLELALQHLWNLHELLRGAHDVVDCHHRHEDKADGEKHLIEMALGVDVDIESPLEQRTERRGDQKRERQSREKGNTHAVDEDDRNVAARHGEGAVGEIDEVHQPERDCESARQDEQQHAVGNAVEQDGKQNPPSRSADASSSSKSDCDNFGGCHPEPRDGSAIAYNQ